MIHFRDLIEAKGAKQRRGESGSAESKSARLCEVKFSDAKPGEFEGYASIFGNEDGGGDVMLQGAFTDTLTEHKNAGTMPLMLLNHGGAGMFGGDPMADLPIGKWTAMSEDTRGLQCKGQLINLDTDAGKRVYGCMKEGVLNGLSIGYQAKDFSYGVKPGEPNRKLKSVHLIEVSPVTFPMNRQATITAVKGAATSIKTIREFEEFLRDSGFSVAAARSIATHGFKARDAARSAEPDPRDEDGIGDAIASPFADLAKLIRS